MKVLDGYNRFGVRNGPRVNNDDLRQAWVLWGEIKIAANLHGKKLGFNLPDDYPAEPTKSLAELAPRPDIAETFEAFSQVKGGKRTDLKGFDLMEFQLIVMGTLWRIAAKYQEKFGLRYKIMSLNDYERSKQGEVRNEIDNYMVLLVWEEGSTARKVSHHADFMNVTVSLVRQFRTRANRILNRKNKKR